MITLYSASGEDSVGISMELFCSTFSFNRNYTFLFWQRGKMGDPNRTYKLRSSSFCSNSCRFTVEFIGPECLSQVNPLQRSQHPLSRSSARAARPCALARACSPLPCGQARRLSFAALPRWKIQDLPQRPAEPALLLATGHQPGQMYKRVQQQKPQARL